MQTQTASGIFMSAASAQAFPAMQKWNYSLIQLADYSASIACRAYPLQTPCLLGWWILCCATLSTRVICTHGRLKTVHKMWHLQRRAHDSTQSEHPCILWTLACVYNGYRVWSMLCNLPLIRCMSCASKLSDVKQNSNVIMISSFWPALTSILQPVPQCSPVTNLTWHP